MKWERKSEKKLVFLLLSAMIIAMLTAGCGKQTRDFAQDSDTKNAVAENVQIDVNPQEEETTATVGENTETTQAKPDQITEGITEVTEMRMLIDGKEVSVEWEDNESVDALRKLAASGGLEVNMSMYGGFEQVGSIGHSIPRNDKQTTTSAGDIVLYSGNQVVVFYGSNSWAYTRLGRITDKTSDELAGMLDSGDVVLRFEVN